MPVALRTHPNAQHIERRAIRGKPGQEALGTIVGGYQPRAFGFDGPSTPHDGELVRFENEGLLVHMDVAAPVKNMKAARQVVKDLLAGKEKAVGKLISGPPAGFAGPVSHEAFQQETITAKPGIYVEVCFMDTQDGRSHSQLGMERIIKIVK